MSHSILKRLLTRYRTGKASRAESFIVEKWYQSFQGTAPSAHGLESQERERETADRIFKRIQYTIDQSVSLQRRRYWSWAAAILVFATTATWSYYYYQQQQHPQYTTHQTAQGESKRITLPDSSTVWLNAGSALRYKEAFGKKERQIELMDGEAYFQVKAMPRAPFTVKAGGTKTTVLGTQFVVSAYSDIPTISIQVTQGKVAVEIDRQMYGALLPGETVIWNKTDRTSLKGQFDRVAFDPGTGRTFLHHASFDELAVRIQRTFGYRLIAHTPQVASRRYTGEFAAGDTITDVLERYSWIHQGSFTIQGREVIMK